MNDEMPGDFLAALANSIQALRLKCGCKGITNRSIAIFQALIIVATVLVSVLTSLAKPFLGKCAVFAHTESPQIHIAQNVLGISIPLLCRFAKPSECFGIISAHALSVAIHHTQIMLGTGIPLLCRLAIPSERFGIVFAYAISVVIHRTQIILGFGIPLFRRSSLINSFQTTSEMPSVKTL